MGRAWRRVTPSVVRREGTPSEAVTLPPRHDAFATRFPDLERAWQLAAEAGANGPLDERTERLVKLGLSIGALLEGAVHAEVRKALAAGVSAREIEQVVALSAGTIGFPAAAAVFTWVEGVRTAVRREMQRRARSARR